MKLTTARLALIAIGARIPKIRLSRRGFLSPPAPPVYNYMQLSQSTHDFKTIRGTLLLNPQIPHNLRAFIIFLFVVRTMAHSISPFPERAVDNTPHAEEVQTANRLWTDGEKKFLLENSTSLTITQLSRALKRSPLAIHRRLSAIHTIQTDSKSTPR